MRTLLKYGALVAAVAILLPIDGFGQGRGPGGGGDQAHARDRAQVERGQADHDRDRMRDRDRIHQPMMDPPRDMTQAQERKQSREQKQIHVPAAGKGPDSDVYGHELMSVRERNRYREQLRLVESDPEQKKRFLAQHREQMQARARAQGKVIGDDGEMKASNRIPAATAAIATLVLVSADVAAHDSGADLRFSTGIEHSSGKYGDIGEVSGFASFRLSRAWRMELYGFTGLTDSSTDYGGVILFSTDLRQLRIGDRQDY